MSMGTRDGSIIGTIMTIHMPRNDAAAPARVCPGICIHAADMVQPPDIVMPPMFDMERQRTTVAAELTAKINAEIPRNARSEYLQDSVTRVMICFSFRPCVWPVMDVVSSARADLSALILIVNPHPFHRMLFIAAFGGEVDVVVSAQ